MSRYRPRPNAGRAGTSSVEVLVALVLTALLIQLSWALLAACRRAAARLVQRSEAIETERLGWHVLSAEMRAGVPLRDWSVAEGGRVLSLRAFRGTAEVCGSRADADGALVRYGGLRVPDPAKDSLLALLDTGEWRVLALTSRSPSTLSCPGWPEDGLERWSWEPAQPGVLLARVFEHGSYHLEERALRYRLGSAGRQPLTPELLESGSVLTHSPAGVSLRLRVRAEEKGTVWDTERWIPSEGGPGA